MKYLPSYMCVKVNLLMKDSLRNRNDTLPLYKSHIESKQVVASCFSKL